VKISGLLLPEGQKFTPGNRWEVGCDRAHAAPHRHGRPPNALICPARRRSS